jgi:hypothetical protein
VLGTQSHAHMTHSPNKWKAAAALLPHQPTGDDPCHRSCCTIGTVLYLAAARGTSKPHAVSDSQVITEAAAACMAAALSNNSEQYTHMYVRVWPAAIPYWTMVINMSLYNIVMT